MSKAPFQNPLIKEDRESTIAEITQYAEWLYIQKTQDADAHRGEVLQLDVLRQAVASLKDA